MFDTLVGGMRNVEPFTHAANFKVEDSKEGSDVPRLAPHLSKVGLERTYMDPVNLVKLFKKLDEMEYLPTILFKFSRAEIHMMFRRILEHFRKLQYEKHYGTPEAVKRSKDIMNKRWADYEAKCKRIETLEKMKKTDEQYDEEEAEQEYPPEPVDIADEIDPEFSFSNTKVYGQWQDQIEDQIKKLEWANIDPLMIEGLRRGIAYHHEGTGQAYRGCVEILFRLGYLKIVLATSSLALGVNMPCRSTVFCGDHLELDGLMYRQMSGRAGRRGFDLLGHVIFIDVPFAKCAQLLASELPMLTGEYSITPTLVLRSMQQLEALPDKAAKLAQVRRLEPMFKECFAHAEIAYDPNADNADGLNKAGHAAVRAQLLQHLRYMTNLLYTERLITKEGKLNQFAGMCTFLFEVEPSNLALNRLFSSGVLHKYLTHFSKKGKVKSEDKTTHLAFRLLRVYAQIIYRIRVFPAVQPLPSEGRRRKHLPSPNCPILEPLGASGDKEDRLREAEVQNVIEAMNENVFSTFCSYAAACTQGKPLTASDTTLPFSDVACKAETTCWAPTP